MLFDEKNHQKNRQGYQKSAQLYCHAFLWLKLPSFWPCFVPQMQVHTNIRQVHAVYAHAEHTLTAQAHGEYIMHAYVMHTYAVQSMF
jgi:hypothetical protein